MNVENAKIDLHLETGINQCLESDQAGSGFCEPAVPEDHPDWTGSVATIRNGAGLAGAGISLFVGAFIVWIAKNVRGKSRE